MPLYKTTPKPSGRMGLLWSLAPVYDTAIIEFGSMGHMIYAKKWMQYTGLTQHAELITTHLAEKDIALGITKRLEESVKEVVKKGQAKAVFLLPSSVPEMIGTDLRAIGEELQELYPQIPVLTFRAGNFKASKEQGMEEAFYELVKMMMDKEELRLTADKEKKESTFNLFGSACDWSRFQSDNREVSRILKGAFSMEEGAVFGSGCDFDSLKSMIHADISLVTRKEGIKGAKLLEKEFGIPFVYGTPYGLSGTTDWIHQVEEVLHKEADKSFLEKEQKETQAVISHCRMWTGYAKDLAKVWVSGEDELSDGMKRFAKEELGFVLSEGGIHMADQTELKEKPGKHQIEIRRSTLSCDINPYDSPFMGFRGAMNVSALWHEYLSRL